MWSRRKCWKLLLRLQSSEKPIVRFDSSKAVNAIKKSPQVLEDDSDTFGIAASFSCHKFIEFLSTNECTFDNGHTCLAVKCKNCNRKNEGLIYVNKITGFFVCAECEDSGHWMHLEPRLKTESKSKGTETEIRSRRKFPKLNTCSDRTDEWAKCMDFCKQIDQLPEEEIKQIIDKFKLKISPKSGVFKYLDIQYDWNNEKLYFPLWNWKKHVVGIKELTINGTEQCDPFKDCYGVLRYIPDKVTRKCTNGILVHNIKDFIAISSYEPAYHVICIPHGIISLPQEILPLFEQYTKLIFWFGNDVPSLNAVRMFARKLQEDRCYVIKKTNQVPSKHVDDEAVDMVKLLNNAEPLMHECITTFSKLKQEIWAELSNTDCAQGIKWRRFPLLNTMLKGHRRGELTILTGPTGSGKTTFLSEYSLDLAAQGVSTLWGSFEIRNQRLACTMLQQMALEPLNSHYEKFEYWSREFEKLPIYFLKFHGQQSIESVMKVVNYASYMHDIQHLIIDNLQFMLGLSLSEKMFMDRYYQQDKVINAFRVFSTQRNCHVTLIIHPRKERETDELTINSIFGSAKASQEADNIMIIQKRMLESLRIKKYLQILKNRYTGDLGIMPLNFDKATLTFGGKGTKTKENVVLERCVNDDMAEPSPLTPSEEKSSTNLVFTERNSNFEDVTRAA